MPTVPPPVRPVRLAFLGCGFITTVHSRHLAAMPSEFACSYASRDAGRAERYRRRFSGVRAYAGYRAALDDPSIDAVVVAVPPHLHRQLALDALAAGKHVLVEKPAFPSREDYQAVIAARDRAGRVVGVGENDHYKPLATTLRRLLADDVIGDLVLAQFTTVARRTKAAGDWRNDDGLAGGDAFFEEGIHWLHLAGSLGPTITRIDGYRPAPSTDQAQGDVRHKSMLVAFEYDSGAAGALYYSREVPAPLRGFAWSKLYGRKGVITFESNGALVLAPGRPTRAGRPARPGRALPRLRAPGFADIRGYRALYRDFAQAVRHGVQPEMDLERAAADHALMEKIYGEHHQ